MLTNDKTQTGCDANDPRQELRNHWLSLDGTSQSLTSRTVGALAVVFGIWHILTNIYFLEPGLWQNAIHFAGFAFLASVVHSPFKANQTSGSAILINLVYGLVIAAAALWVAGAETLLYQRTLAVTGQSWQFSFVDWVAGFVLIFSAIDLSRRVSGWVIPILALLSLSYILFLGAWLPGVFRSATLPLNDVMFRTLYNDEGMFGILTSISSTNITMFMIFGGFLVASRASDFVIELSKLVAGRIRGGAAFVAVISSALTGTISGSAVANTASTGVITIPLMKSNGFSGKFAAGVETAASTGGQLMPPIMGAGAFVMASYTSIPYATIVTVSIVPALLYFLSVAFIIRIEAVKHQIGDELDLTIDYGKLVSGSLTFVLPLTTMIWLLMTGVTPAFAASWAIAALISVSWATWAIAKVIRLNSFNPVFMDHRRIARAFLIGIKSSILTGVLLVTIGIMNNAIVTSGVGNGFSLMIVQWSQGSLVLAILLIGLASLVLGMGLPVTAAYIILAILTAPALAGVMADSVIVDQLVAGVSDPAKAAVFGLIDSVHVADVASGLSRENALELLAVVPFDVAITLRPVMIDPETQIVFLLTAHLIIFWLSQDSNVTPPVCLAAFTAAGIAGSKPMATGFQAWKISKGLYILPLMFAYTPLISGDFHEVLQIGFFALFGIYALNALMQNHAEGPLNWLLVPMLALGGTATFIPLVLLVNAGGALLVILAVILSKRNLPKEQ